MGYSVDQLVECAKDGTLSAADVDTVAVRLTSEPLSEDSYPLLARLAVQTSCTFWGEADRYRDVALSALEAR